MSEQPLVPGSERLESWKAIATYLNRDVRTVMRWEKFEGLPIHRQRHLSRSSVYGFPNELDAWRANRHLEPPAAPARRSKLRPLAVAATLAIGILSGGGGKFAGPLTALQAGPIDRVLAWSGEPSMASDESMSPDGRYMAYIDMTSRELAIRDLRNGRAHTLTKIARAQGYVDAPFVSNDGKHVVFYAADKNRQDGLWVLPLDADESIAPRRLVEGTVWPTQWTSNDREILVVASHDDIDDIALVTVATGAMRVLKSVALPGTGEFVAISPDGRFVAYDVRADVKDRQRDLWLIATSDGSGKPILPGPTSDSVVAWSPDGNFLVFRSDRIGSRGDGLWALPVRDGVVSGNPILLRDDFRGTPVSLTRAGTLLFEQGNNVEDLLVASLNVDGSAPTQAPQSASHDPRALSRRPRWSNDGQWFMYVTRRANASVISMRAIKTGVVMEVPLSLDYVSTFDLSSDGRKIVCRGTDLERHTGVFMVDTATGAVETVVLWQNNVSRQFVPQFSADGRSLTYITGDYHGNNKYIERNVQTGVERVIASLPVGNGNYLRRSPDSRYLLTHLETHAPERSTLRVYDVLTKEAHDVFQVDRASAFNTEDGVQWMPDSRAIVANVSGAGENSRELWWIPVQGGQPRRLDVGVDHIVNSGIAIDLEGKHIAFADGVPLPSDTAVLHYEFRLLEHFLPKREGLGR